MECGTLHDILLYVYSVYTCRLYVMQWPYMREGHDRGDKFVPCRLSLSTPVPSDKEMLLSGAPWWIRMVLHPPSVPMFSSLQAPTAHFIVPTHVWVSIGAASEPPQCIYGPRTRWIGFSPSLALMMHCQLLIYGSHRSRPIACVSAIHNQWALTSFSSISPFGKTIPRAVIGYPSKHARGSPCIHITPSKMAALMLPAGVYDFLCCGFCLWVAALKMDWAFSISGIRPFMIPLHIWPIFLCGDLSMKYEMHFMYTATLTMPPL